MISAIKGGFTMILSVTLLCLPASWSCAATYTAHIRMNPDNPAYIQGHVEGKLTVAKCCLFDSIFPPVSTICTLSYRCAPKSAPVPDNHCFNFAQNPVYGDNNTNSMTYQSCIYSDTYCTPQEGECP